MQLSRMTSLINSSQGAASGCLEQASFGVGLRETIIVLSRDTGFWENNNGVYDH